MIFHKPKIRDLFAVRKSRTANSEQGGAVSYKYSPSTNFLLQSNKRYYSDWGDS